MQIIRPDGSVATPPATHTPSPHVLSGRRIGILDNCKPNADVLLGRLAERLVERVAKRITD